MIEIKDPAFWANCSTSRKGAIAELMASNWLMSQGYDVFRSLDPSSKADLVAVRQKEVILIDVCYAKRKGWNNMYADSKKYKQEILQGLGIKVLYVLDEGGCQWREELFDCSRPQKECAFCGGAFLLNWKLGSPRIYCSENCKKEGVLKKAREKIAKMITTLGGKCAIWEITGESNEL